MSDIELENLRANKFFVMTPDGNGMSLDELNENVNLWFKKCLIAPTFQQNIDRSKHIMTLMKCGYETFGKSTSRRTRANQSENVNKLIELFQRTNIFPMDDTTSRDFDENFFWCKVKIPKASGTDRDKKRESAETSGGMKGMFNVLCVPEDLRAADYAEFEEDGRPNDDDALSVMSSVAGADEDRAQYNENSDDDDDGDTDKKIQTSLKNLGNVQRKKKSPLLFKDLLGEDGDDAMHGMKERHIKSLATIKNRIDTVRLVNSHFEGKIKRRMDLLDVVTEQSTKKTFHKRNRPWKTKFKNYILEKRTRRDR